MQNLCTSTLAYDALISASYLHKEFGNIEKADYYLKTAETLKENIVKYFSKNVEGYATFMYCKEEPNLRSWISMPMVVGIFERSKATKDALLSPKTSSCRRFIVSYRRQNFLGQINIVHPKRII